MILNFIGDVYLDKKYDLDFKLDNYIFNLEYALSKTGTPALNKVNLGTDSTYIKDTFNSFPLAVNLANNHIMDYGEKSYSQTISYLNKNKILYFGAGTVLNNFNNPCIIQRNEHDISLLGYCCPSASPIFGTDISNGAAPLDLELINKDIEKEKEKNNFIVVNLHWGDEEISYPKPSDVNKAKRVIDMGADLIIGHHAHVIQSIMTYKGKKIYFGIGNFLFPNLNVPSYFNGNEFTNSYKKMQNFKNRTSLLLELKGNQVYHKTTFFDNKKVFIKKVKIPQWIPKTDNAYLLYKKIHQRIGTLNRFIKNPKIPTIKQFKIFLGLDKRKIS